MSISLSSAAIQNTVTAQKKTGRAYLTVTVSVSFPFFSCLKMIQSAFLCIQKNEAVYAPFDIWVCDQMLLHHMPLFFRRSLHVSQALLDKGGQVGGDARHSGHSVCYDAENRSVLQFCLHSAQAILKFLTLCVHSGLSSSKCGDCSGEDSLAL